MANRYHDEELGIGARVETIHGIRGTIVRRDQPAQGEETSFVIAGVDGSVRTVSAAAIRHVFADREFQVAIPPRTLATISGIGRVISEQQTVAVAAYELRAGETEELSGHLYVLQGDAELSNLKSGLRLELEDRGLVTITVDGGEQARWRVRGLRDDR